MGYRVPAPPIGEDGQELIIPYEGSLEKAKDYIASVVGFQFTANVASRFVEAYDCVSTLNDLCDDVTPIQEDWFCQYCAQENEAEAHHCNYCGGNKVNPEGETENKFPEPDPELNQPVSY